ncbi:amine oxidase domain protein [Natronomonas moolapensis 8.8.11]|uniref:Amine oxidase domain protein n=1 Tax=Natronomonas moolapensis (strain DSM 18674 / CECT 7526 / JCM 14361 / 8.8.11) TaxID=268739 RepID=M1XS35_NATM8|nr:NAD(P)/FAD-dependent oxidoreductase [Natronomonas moolapensis]CCQ37115.1 amine oxidase domain protein [Natronomonas moolapensis 8.8.11]
MHVVVAGGGLAGLVAARHLAETGAEVELFEARERVGGRVRTRTVGGHTLDRGFQVLFTAYPAARRELDFEALDLRQFAPGATIARPNHRSTLADPLGDPSAALPTLLNRDVRTADKLRLFRLQRELRGRRWDEILGDDVGTIGAYLADRGFSRAFVERFAAPFYGGITLDRGLGTASSVFEYTFKALSEGDTVVPAGGMGEIPAQLRDRATAAGADVTTGIGVTGLETDPLVVETEAGERSPDAVVVATGPRTAAELTGVETPEGTRASTTVHCSIPEHQRLDTGSRIVLNAADAEPNTVAPMSAAAPEYAPEGRQLLSATFLGVREDDDEALGETVRSALSAWFPENHFGGFETVGVDRIEFAQFEQPPGFRSSLPAVDAPDGPVFLAGGFTEWSAIQGALASGRRAAEAALDTVR